MSREKFTHIFSCVLSTHMPNLGIYKVRAQINLKIPDILGGILTYITLRKRAGMKKLSLFTFLVIVSVAFYSCKKDISTTASFTPTESHWTYSGHTFAADSAAISGAILYTIDAVGNSVNITFSAAPDSNGTYAVTQASPTASQCNMQIYDQSALRWYYGISGNVNVTLASNHITATFTNLNTIYWNGSQYDTVVVSGTVVQYP
jgi:hypothetical protein